MQKKEDINYLYNLKTYFGFLFRYKSVVITTLIVVALAEVIFSLDRFFFKAVIDNGTSYAAGELSKNALGAFFLSLAIAYITISIIRVLFRAVRTHLGTKIYSRTEFDLKQKYFNHLLNLSHGFHTTHKTGSFISRINRGANAMDRMNDFFLANAFPLIIQFIIVAVSIGYFDSATVITVISMAVVFIIFSMYIQRIQKPWTIANNRAEDIEKGNLADFFTNIDSIKYFGREKHIGNRFYDLGYETHRLDLKRASYQVWLRAGHQIVIAIGTFLVFYFPLKQFMAGNISIGAIALIYALYGGFLPYLGFFVDGLRGFYRAMEDFNDLFEYGKVENDIKDLPNADKLKIKQGEIEFRDVVFSYQKRKIFDKFNLILPEGKKIALVGHSGSGKTTIAKLLYRLYDLDAGQILIDGKDIKTVEQESLRSELSIVPQECVLFDDTIYNNIAFSNPRAKKEEVMRAIKFAQLDKIIQNFPKKENTIVGERGVRLSGGEKQRVSIARALLADKKVLVLDEATSSLDSKTEHDIQQDLQKLMKGRTSVIIAHRLSTIMSADVIVVLDKGKIVQQGKHSELIKKPGTYRQLWNLQKGGYISDD